MLFNILLIVHIAGGGLSFLLGGIILGMKKGDSVHQLVGSVYFYAMLTAALVSLPMACIHPNYFLFIIGVFTSYMLLTGKRYLKKKSIAEVKWMDWALTIVMAIFGLGFIGFGYFLLISGNSFGVVMLVFGGVSLLFVYKDVANYRGKSKIRNFGTVTHIQRMIGSYIASVTAFLVVNNTFLPNVVAWLLPTVLLVPLLIRWSRKYQVQE